MNQLITQAAQSDISKMEYMAKQTAMDALKSFRQEQGLSLLEISCRTGLSTDALDRMELGKKTIHFYHCCLLAAAFGKKVSITFE